MNALPKGSNVNADGGGEATAAIITGPAQRIALAPDFAAVQDQFERQGWTDGLPIVPPTPELVAEMVAGSGLSADAVIAPVAPSMAPLTVEKLAINAVMAGCRPLYMPVLIAALRALARPAFNLAGFQATTHPGGPLLWINGPARGRIGLNCATNLFGPGVRANATIGRALRLVMINIGEGIPGKNDFATQGNPCKYSYCGGENEEQSPWPPLHTTLGYSPEESTALVLAAEGPHNINDHHSQRAPDLLTIIADTMNVIGANTFYLGNEAMLILSPEHAGLLARAGMRREDVRDELCARLRVDLARVPEAVLARMARIRKSLATPAPDNTVGWFEDPAQLLIAVAGGPGLHSVFIPGFGISSMQIERIEPLEQS